MTKALHIEGLEKTFHLGFIGALRPFRRLADRLQMKGIAYRVDAVRGISLEVQRGEVFGFLGPNGAGKSTTMMILTTLLKPTSGNASVCGFDVVTNPSKVRKNIGFVQQEIGIDEYLTARKIFNFNVKSVKFQQNKPKKELKRY